MTFIYAHRLYILIVESLIYDITMNQRDPNITIVVS